LKREKQTDKGVCVHRAVWFHIQPFRRQVYNIAHRLQ
jgi:hypothetical protein